MLAFQLVAIVFLGLSAGFMFGPQILIYGPNMARDMIRNEQVQFVGGCWMALVLLVVAAPYLATAFSSGGSAISLVVVDVFTMSFRPV